MRDASLVIPKYIVPPHPALVNTPKKSASSLQTSWHPGYGEEIFVTTPLLTCPTQVSNVLGVVVEFTFCVCHNLYGLINTEICIKSILSSILDI